MSAVDRPAETGAPRPSREAEVVPKVVPLPTRTEGGDLYWPCGCARVVVGSGVAWFACEKHGGSCGAEFVR